MNYPSLFVNLSLLSEMPALAHISRFSKTVKGLLLHPPKPLVEEPDNATSQ